MSVQEKELPVEAVLVEAQDQAVRAPAKRRGTRVEKEQPILAALDRASQASQASQASRELEASLAEAAPAKKRRTPAPKDPDAPVKKRASRAKPKPEPETKPKPKVLTLEERLELAAEQVRLYPEVAEAQVVDGKLRVTTVPYIAEYRNRHGVQYFEFPPITFELRPEDGSFFPKWICSREDQLVVPHIRPNGRYDSTCYAAYGSFLSCTYRKEEWEQWVTATLQLIYRFHTQYWNCYLSKFLVPGVARQITEGEALDRGLPIAESQFS